MMAALVIGGVPYVMIAAIIGGSALIDWRAERRYEGGPLWSPEEQREAARRAVMAPVWPLWLLAEYGPLAGRLWHDAVRPEADDRRSER